MNFWTALITGITTGGLTCMAVQGGLLFGILARQETDESVPRWQRMALPVSAFLVAKIFIYTLLGLGLGWLGNRIQLTNGMKIGLQTFAALVMIATGLRLIWPRLFPWMSINPPAGVRRFIRQNAKSQALIAPAVLGLLTILIPCGTTQAMEVAAIASGHPLAAASILFGFTLGTAPFFILVGVLAKGVDIFRGSLKYAAAAIVIGLGLYTMNGVLVSIDSPYSYQREAAAFQAAIRGQSTTDDVAASTHPVIAVLSNGYNPSDITVPAGEAVQLELRTQGNLGCTSVFRLPKLNITQDLPQQGSTTINTTFPNAGTYTFSCGMGMYTGTITAI